MSNTIKYSTQTENNTLKKGDFVIGVNNVDYGPTSETGYYNTITPPEGGYVVYKNRGDNQRSIYVAESDEELVLLKDDFGATGSTANDVLVWAAQQDDVLILNNPLDNIVTDGLVLYLDAVFTCSYPKSNTTWYDLSGNEKNGKLINGPTFDSGNGGSIVFDGTNDTVNLGIGNTVFPLPQISYEFFFKSLGTVPTTGTFPGLLGLTYGVRLLVNSTNLNAVFDDGSTFRQLTTSGTNNYRDGNWYYVAVTHDGTNFKIYVNGTLSNSRTSTWTGTTRWPTNSFNLGRDNNNSSQYFYGHIGTFRLYNRVLPASEIEQNYNSQKSRFGL